MDERPTIHLNRTVSPARIAAEVFVFCIAAVLVSQTAVFAKRVGVGPALVALDATPAQRAPVTTVAARMERPVGVEMSNMLDTTAPEVVEVADTTSVFTPDAGYTRYYDGRPIRPARTIWMTVTAYSPDHRSCGKWADGRTATNHSVWTNAMRLVAADTKILPFGSLVSVPGYADSEVVPVLDRGGAIKGHRLDVLYATHQIARKWGVQRLPVVVWEYADGQPARIR